MLILYGKSHQPNHLVDDLHDMAQADTHQLPLDKTNSDQAIPGDFGAALTLHGDAEIDRTLDSAVIYGDVADSTWTAVAEQAGELFEPLALGAGLTLHTSSPEQTVIVHGDRIRIIQVLQNLQGNGLRHAHSRVDLRLW